jgi:hypothetical protein
MFSVSDINPALPTGAETGPLAIRTDITLYKQFATLTGFFLAHL